MHLAQALSHLLFLLVIICFDCRINGIPDVGKDPYEDLQFGCYA